MDAGELESLADAARRGDRAALTELLAESQPDIRQFAKRSCRTAEDVEDAIQHTMLVLFTRVESFRGASKFTSWLFAIVRNECNRLRRRATRFLAQDVDRMIDELEDLDRVELLDVLTSAIQSLPRPLRDVFVMREIRGLTTAETASVLGITESNVKVRLHRGRQHLQRTLRSQP